MVKHVVLVATIVAIALLGGCGAASEPSPTPSASGLSPDQFESLMQQFGTGGAQAWMYESIMQAVPQPRESLEVPKPADLVMTGSVTDIEFGGWWGQNSETGNSQLLKGDVDEPPASAWWQDLMLTIQVEDVFPEVSESKEMCVVMAVGPDVKLVDVQRAFASYGTLTMFVEPHPDWPGCSMSLGSSGEFFFENRDGTLTRAPFLRDETADVMTDWQVDLATLEAAVEVAG